MGLMSDYIAKRMSGAELEAELFKLIGEYNKKSGNYLLVYAGALSKMIPQVSLNMDDYYIIADLLRKAPGKKLAAYIETPGGSGEAAEEIVNCFRSQFDHVEFVVSGEAKSAGTLLVMSGDEISMTRTGSLGPIDAQVVIGRGQVSAHDYMEWVNGKQADAEKQGKLNPFDATMVAQISPGELNGVSNALEFAHDLVVKWLPQYKFKNWNKTKTRKKSVTDDMKQKRAKEIAKALTDHSRWRSHGRSLKITDLESIGLKINSIDSSDEISDIVYRLQVVIKLLFVTTSIYKIFATVDSKIFGMATQVNAASITPQVQKPDTAELEVPCPKCGIVHKLYAKFVPDPKIDTLMAKKGFKKFPKDAKITCSCGFELDLTGPKNEIETNVGRRMVQ